MPEIVLAILRHRPDVAVLTEYRTTTGGQIRGVLADHGLEYQHCSRPSKGSNGVLLAAREPLKPADPPSASPRWVCAYLPESSLLVTGVHLPDGSDPPAQNRHWRSLLEHAKGTAAGRHLLIGDFNTGRPGLDEAGRTFRCAACLGKLETLGYRDAWRTAHPMVKEHSWFSHAGSGFRIDTAFASPALAGDVARADYSHEERENRVSDHSVLLVGVVRRAGPGGTRPRENRAEKLFTARV